TNNLSALQVQLSNEFSTYADIEADIVALQEVDQRHVEQLTTLSPEQFPHRAIHPNGTSGQGILSAYPIIEDDYSARGFTGESFGHQRVVLQIAESQRLVVYSVHPFHPGIGVAFFDSTMRQTEITAILDQVRQETDPVILMGDFNTSDFSQDYRMITSTYSDVFRVAGYGLGWTFPRVSSIDTTFLRLDYIFLSDELGAQSAQVWRGDLGSDHNLLYADIFVLNE
ncbi:MAG: endonuclease/exonuclease/phosphatase family protein, partial [Chloroflexota bacterium]